jgi:Mg-chelatase subunit ChlD
MATDIPTAYKCPITYDLMVDPVVGTDGYTYERSVITEWLDTRGTSPMNPSMRMRTSDLKSNYALKTAIEEWVAAQSASVAPRSPIDAVSKEFKVTATTTGLRIETDASEPMPIQMINILDSSGSMGESANQKAAEGDQMSRMDLVKHSVLTVAHMLSKAPSTSMQLIGFSSKATQLMPMKTMNAKGLQCVQAVLTQLYPGGGTNLWDGLRLGLDAAALAAKSKPNTNIIVNLLTDGEPSPDMLPLLGLVPTLKKKLAGLGCSVTLNVFGFGYNLDSKLLEQICIEGGGSYGFIPDCSMVGTIFINSTATALTTVTRNVRLTIGDKTGWVGAMQKGVPRHVTLEVGAAVTEVTITYEEGTVAKAVLARDATPSNRIYLQRLKEQLLPLKSARGFHAISDVRLMALYATVKAIDDPLCDAIARDIFSDDDNEGQLTKCISRADWYSSWGINHLIAYARALDLEQCINFKDKVLQHFTGEAFANLQEQGIQIFTDLPAPIPSIKDYRSCGAAAARSVSPINMAVYVNADGGCFWGYNFVKLENGFQMLVKDIRKGDTLWGGHKVKCILYTPIDSAVMSRHPNGLLITPYHPIRVNGTWVFPSTALPTKQHNDLGGYYNFVLESGHIAVINGVEVCTLGHGFTDNSVISHPYFGTQNVIADLSCDPGFQNGYMVLDKNAVKRDPNTLLVTSIY